MIAKFKIDFFKQHWPFAKAASDKYGISPVIILANQVKETGWRPQVIAPGAHKRKNYFGLTATRSSRQTPHWKGKSSKGGGGLLYRIYDTVQNNFFDYALVIKRNYPAAAAAGSDVKAFVEVIAQKYTGSKSPVQVESYKHEMRSFALQIEEIGKKLGYLPA